MNHLNRSIDSLIAELQQLPALSAEQREKLWRKFRLEWNYNSNHIEGNTLTYGQTELLLFFDKAVGEKEMREYEEMKAHDAAIRFVQEEAANKEKPLTESFIRTLNEIILVRPFWKEAQTADGQSTRRLIEIGKYKQFPNSVLLQNGEMFHYAKPEEVAAKMEELVYWYNNEKELSVQEVAAYLHYRFVCIHPFDDGNGRVARLLMNYVLLKNNLPPVIIKSADKANYLLALNKADTGDIKAFADYITDQLAWSINLTIKAINNESLEEPDDLDKEIALLKRGGKEEESVQMIKEGAILQKLWNRGLYLLIENLTEKLSKFNELFVKHRIDYDFDDKLYTLEYLNDSFSDEFHQKRAQNLLAITFSFDYYKYNGTNNFNSSTQIRFEFLESKYIIEYYGTEGMEKFEFLYHQLLNGETRQMIVDKIAKKVLHDINLAITK